MSDSDRKLMEPYEQALGRFVIAWNDLHDSMSWIFSSLIGADSNLGFPIWNSIIVDRGQREMLMAAARNSPLLEDKDERIEDIEWLCGQALGLSNNRNDAIHAPIKIVRDGDTNKSEVIAWGALGNPRAMSLGGKDLMSQLVWFYLSAECLRDYAELINGALRHPSDTWPWPRRPLMPTLGQSGSQRA